MCVVRVRNNIRVNRIRVFSITAVSANIYITAFCITSAFVYDNKSGNQKLYRVGARISLPRPPRVIRNRSKISGKNPRGRNRRRIRRRQLSRTGNTSERTGNTTRNFNEGRFVVHSRRSEFKIITKPDPVDPLESELLVLFSSLIRGTAEKYTSYRTTRISETRP